ncbi:hypothetical protein J1605_003548 [Eschrichtius robustus]|uniref:Myocardin n=1 Tax=Eschrichtius robustus TaxID=9764 RepID=A0AB34HQ96_ESCRO|nr:hypothetical protein J1605_003548 [Eschrichtius robustus]
MDRLRPFQDCSGNPVPNFGDITTVTFPVTPSNALPNYQSSPPTGASSNGFYHFGSTSSSPPISPASSDLSVAGSLPDTFHDASPSFGLHPSPVHVCPEESLVGSLNGGCCIPPELDGLDSEKDKMLVEKQKVINELTWKLQQEQRHVEELRLQLQKQKRGSCPEKKLPPLPAAPVKQEDAAPSCPFASPQVAVRRPSACSEGQPPAREDAQIPPLGGTACAEPSGQTSVLPSTFLSPQCSPQHSPLGAVKSPQHISLPPSPNNHYFLPASSGAQGDEHRVSSPVGSQARTAQPPASFEPASAGGQLSFDHYGADSNEHLEVLLNSQSPLGKVGDVALLKLGSEEPPFDGMMDGFSGKAAEDLFNAHEILPGPLSPMQTQYSPSSVDSSGLPLSFTESPWESMEWLDITPPSSTPSFSSLPTGGPSIFNIDFLDVTDLNLNSPMDLHLQQW